MDNHYQYYNGNYQNADRKTNKVYVNPNFNRLENVTSASNLYFNPNFPHTNPNMYQHIQQHNDLASKPNIHVNPNFIRNTNMYSQTSNPVVNNSNLTISKPSMTSANYSGQQTQEPHLCQAAPRHVGTSRYCYVRQKENLVTKPPSTNALTTTVKVNKYKTVSLHIAQKNLAIATSFIQQQASSSHVQYTNSSSSKPMVSNSYNTTFKLKSPSLNQPRIKHISMRRSSLLNRSTQSRKKNSKALMKKNNIPCPLYKKYGQCLRILRGHCEYLHDKKHVSICRKFIKGICHNSDCLLSHDLTDKKMPTCFFYLQGACTKENCPYLHVKLNEKSKICLDFLKGYCENGDKCLYRHVCSSKDTKKPSRLVPQNTHNITPSKGNSVVMFKRKKSHTDRSEDVRKIKRVDVPQKSVKEKRYFIESIEHKSSDEICNDNIKPSRVKLGTLPSFIQL